MSDPSQNATIIFKIATAAQWRDAQGHTFSGSPDDKRDGYIHLSCAHQLEGTLSKHFQGQADLVLIAFNAHDLAPNLAWETSRDGALFPHYYGELETRHALYAMPLASGGTGRALLPEGLL